jgi:hypothetical protein
VRGNLLRMSGRGETGGATELEAAARRLAALAERLRVVRAQLSGAGGAAHPASTTSSPQQASDIGGAKGEAR